MRFKLAFRTCGACIICSVYESAMEMKLQDNFARAGFAAKVAPSGVFSSLQ